jgi:hypothetical protein
MIELYKKMYYSIIMKKTRYSATKLVDLFKQQKIASMQELKDALGTRADATVFRKLNELSYLSSYSHRGRYYTLDSIPVFDQWGLWPFRSVWFSERGTLLATAEALIDGSEQGFFETELESFLHVEVRGCLLKLIQKERVCREKVLGRYLYCSRNTNQRKKQIHARRIGSTMTIGGPIVPAKVLPDELKAAIVLFFALLDEKQRRIYAGLESLKLGHGGDQRIAELLGIDRGTVTKGREQLLAQEVEVGRTRKRGGGRKPVEKKRRK